MHDLDDALTALGAAVALGMAVPAPVGSTVYVAEAREYEDSGSPTYPVMLTLHNSRDTALQSLTDYVNGQWDEQTDAAPWWDDCDDPADDECWQACRTRWYSQRTPEEGLDVYFKDCDYGVWTIEEMRVDRPD